MSIENLDTEKGSNDEQPGHIDLANNISAK
jgi:hypothetical protein